MLEMAQQRVERVLAARLAQRLEHRGQHARVLVLRASRGERPRSCRRPPRRAPRRAPAHAEVGVGGRARRARARSPRGLVRASAPKAAPRTQGSRVGHERDQPRPQRGVGRQHGERAQRLAAQHVARRGERAPRRPGSRGRRRSPRARAARAARPSSSGSRTRRSSSVDRGGVLQRARDRARRERASGVVRVDRGQRAPGAARAPRAASRPRSPPTSRSAVGRRRGAPSRPPRGRLQPRQRERARGAARVQRVGGVAGLVAAHGHAADRLRQGVDHQLARSPAPRAGRRSSRAPRRRGRARWRRCRRARRAAGRRRPRSPASPSANAAIRRTSTSASFMQLDERRHERGVARSRPAASAARRRTPRSGSRRSAARAPRPVERRSSSSRSRASLSRRGGDGAGGRLPGREDARPSRRRRAARPRRAGAARRRRTRRICRLLSPHATAKKSRPSTSPAGAASRAQPLARARLADGAEVQRPGQRRGLRRARATGTPWMRGRSCAGRPRRRPPRAGRAARSARDQALPIGPAPQTTAGARRRAGRARAPRPSVARKRTGV